MDRQRLVRATQAGTQVQPGTDGDGTVVVSKVTLVVPLLMKGGRRVLVVVRKSRARMVDGGQGQKKKNQSQSNIGQGGPTTVWTSYLGSV